ncbi:MAG: RdgB/HAM1 family non-canonical purine NTP pyrophosphatase [Crocinitomicaceae bacterium]|nr:RdgB/HAM1 family non-canonical purine NTP pyrophosphatase [Crocinitomicaceae bacterium]
MNILFATSNQNKAKEIAALLPSSFELMTLNDIDIKEDIPETQDTLEGNAKQKSEYILNNFQLDCFADDTGLEIPSLNNEPGVRSARYAGEQRDSEANMQLILERLEGKEDRSAQFRTVISLELNGEQHLFEGIVSGTIRTEKSGDGGFGYDPIFEPENCGKTFGEMSMDEKNSYSHRARAFEKMIAFLSERSK